MTILLALARQSSRRQKELLQAVADAASACAGDEGTVRVAGDVIYVRGAAPS